MVIACSISYKLPGNCLKNDSLEVKNTDTKNTPPLYVAGQQWKVVQILNQTDAILQPVSHSGIFPTAGDDRRFYHIIDGNSEPLDLTKDFIVYRPKPAGNLETPAPDSTSEIAFANGQLMLEYAFSKSIEGNLTDTIGPDNNIVKYVSYGDTWYKMS